MSTEALAAVLREREKNWVTHPDLWPMWPFLPMKRGTGNDKEMGYIIEASDAPLTRVFFGNIFAPDPVNDKFIDYANIDEMLAEWKID